MNFQASACRFLPVLISLVLAPVSGSAAPSLQDGKAAGEMAAAAQAFLASLPPERTRQIGLAAVAGGTLLVWIARRLLA